MKKNQIIILSIFFLITAVIFITINSNKKEELTEVKKSSGIEYVAVAKVKNNMQTIKIASYGQIMPNMELEISFEVQGKLERGDIRLKPGSKFQAGQLLYSINNEEAFYTLSARKSQLANALLTIMPDIELDFPKDHDKWMRFLDALQAGNRLPELPRISNKKEQHFLTSRNILSEYYSIKSSEVRMEKYFFLAPFSGSVLETYLEEGAIASPGVRIAKIASSSNFEVKVPISLALLEDFQSQPNALFIDAQGEAVGKGKIARISSNINQKTQSVDVYFSIQALPKKTLYHGMFLTAEINETVTKKSMVVPRNAVSNEEIYVLKNDKLIAKKIEVIGAKPDSLFVSGLEDGSTIVLAYPNQVVESLKYKGINR